MRMRSQTVQQRPGKIEMVGSRGLTPRGPLPGSRHRGNLRRAERALRGRPGHPEVGRALLVEGATLPAEDRREPLVDRGGRFAVRWVIKENNRVDRT